MRAVRAWQTKHELVVKFLSEAAAYAVDRGYDRADFLSIAGREFDAVKRNPPETAEQIHDKAVS